ncbi:kinase-like domain-containing protein [Boeremia exigua]|uniref:kinase-like domain-containing protein n=1 Tax=Boeremia exigua TaxID=749465 RepID=UPI001E8CA8D7|nr:kinase-like domain-containing protein [Boeremia exigua]KAH6620368.1 kinase-like domain-containing protein [Boeremia exigua]
MSRFFPQGRETARRNATHRRPPTSPDPGAERSEQTSSDSRTEVQTRVSTPTMTASLRSPGSINLSADALGSSDAWTSCYLGEHYEPKSLADIIDEVSVIFNRIVDAKSYLDSAESTWDELCIASGQLQISIDYATYMSPDEQLHFKAVSTLGHVYKHLGDNDKAQTTFLSVCPPLPLTRAAFRGLHTWHKIDALLDYIRFLVTSTRDLDQVERVAKALPWASPEILRSGDRKSYALLTLIEALNDQGRHEEASETLVTFDLVSATKSMVDPSYNLQRAVAAAGQGLRKEAEHLFVNSFVLTSLIVGAWHTQTLYSLFQFGRALKAWCEHGSAVKILLMCCEGYYYTLGPSHPYSIRAHKELKACKSAGAAILKLRQLGHTHCSRKRKWSLAYERSHLTTPMELLKPEIPIDYARLADTLDKLLSLNSQNLSGCVAFNVKRSLAWCNLEQNELNVASTSLYALHRSITNIKSNVVSAQAYRATLASDEAICSAKSAELGTEFMHQRSKMVYLGFKDFPKDRSHQVKAIVRRLTTYKLTHFTRDMIFSDPPLIVETDRENLGSGSSAVVDTIQMGRDFYARKTVDLPRQTQRQLRLREGLRNEIAIIHALDHPHIIRVLLTYEGVKHFSIIMHPLADCDLETYLLNRTCDSTRERDLIQKWMICLANTLAFIHSKDVRHKDIKPRNLLVKGEKIFFTDFGSGHIFDDSGNSTTDGPSFGHTKAYCAPEVIKNANRNRSSDVFSLGCVMIEMVAWSSGIPIADYLIGVRAVGSRTDVILYHESIARIKTWFQNEQRLTQQSKEIFSEVLERMICKNPQQRWKAAKVSQVIEKVLKHVGCIKCGIDLWVSDSTAE